MDRVGKSQFLIKTIFNSFLAVNFLQFLVMKSLDPDRYLASNAGSGSVSGINETLISWLDSAMRPNNDWTQRYNTNKHMEICTSFAS